MMRVVVAGADCWVENMELRFNRTSRQSSNAVGVETRVPGWGNTDTVEYIDPSWTAWVLGNLGVYANYLVEALVHNGFERGVSIRGAPYDFRYAPHSQLTYFSDLRQLIEETWQLNGGRKVVLVAHSMGGLYAAYFLFQQTPDWKDRYIEALITVNTPWAGTVVVVEMFAAGINWEIDSIDPLVMRDQQRSSETGYLLLPTADDGIWTPCDVLLTTPDRNYTVHNYNQFFQDIGAPDGPLHMEAIQTSGKYRWFDRPLGVPVYCLYSSGIPTPERLLYDETMTFPDGEPRAVMGDGDGTVNRRSLEGCRHWQRVQPPNTVTVKEYMEIGHNELLGDPVLISDILDVTQQ